MWLTYGAGKRTQGCKPASECSMYSGRLFLHGFRGQATLCLSSLRERECSNRIIPFLTSTPEMQTPQLLFPFSWNSQRAVEWAPL